MTQKFLGSDFAGSVADPSMPAGISGTLAALKPSDTLKTKPSLWVFVPVEDTQQQWNQDPKHDSLPSILASPGNLLIVITLI
ncbi:hypothetical protein ABK905_26115 [Acerihabitans sp. KWT182]|uniref:Uncharacterized protein n=1 Tax=Acerihabitans sp. KWT182 TaxID=3157919 RepID=A0AAU7QA26_9GAMM